MSKDNSESVLYSAVCYTDLRRQKIELSMEIREQLDTEKKKHATNYEQELQDIVSERKSAVDLS